MEMTPEVRNALAFITAKAECGVCPTLSEVQNALNKRSRSHTSLVLGRMKQAGLIDWTPRMQRTLRPAIRGKQMLTVAKMYHVPEKMKWPMAKWRAVDSLWLDPRLLKLHSEDKHIVLEAGRDWKPANLKVNPGDRVIVALPLSLELPDKGRLAMVCLRDKVEAYPLDFVDDGWIINPVHLLVSKIKFIGIVVAVVSVKA